jgi:hypothetical protein
MSAILVTRAIPRAKAQRENNSEVGVQARDIPVFGYGPAALGNSQSLHLASNRMSDYPRLQ